MCIIHPYRSLLGQQLSVIIEEVGVMLDTRQGSQEMCEEGNELGGCPKRSHGSRLYEHAPYMVCDVENTTHLVIKMQ